METICHGFSRKIPLKIFFSVTIRQVLGHGFRDFFFPPEKLKTLKKIVTRSVTQASLSWILLGTLEVKRKVKTRKLYL